MSVNKICHLSDIHIRNLPTRNQEYENVFNELYKSLNENKPDRIVITGDLVHDYLDLGTEQLVLAENLLKNLSNIAPVRIIRGNHDFRKKNKKRLDAISAITYNLNSNIKYYNKTGFFTDDNIVWCVWHHGEKHNNPWKTKEGKKILKNKDSDNYTYIDLFHDPIYKCVTPSGLEKKNKIYYKISDFNGHYSFFGDIHLLQYFSNKTKAYSSSLIAQNFAEGDDNFHGYLMWDINNNNIDEIPIYNEYSYKNIKLTPFTDFDDLDFDIENPTKYMRIRIIWATLPSIRNKKNKKKITNYLKESGLDNNIISISHKNEFIEDDIIEVDDETTVNDITNHDVQHEIFKDYLDKIGYEENMIDDILSLDNELAETIDIDENTNIEWSIVKFGGENFMSFEKIDIDWRDMDGLYQITGINTAGKTTILKLISYVLFGETLETKSRKKHGDYRFVNDKNDIDYCEGYQIIEANGNYYGIKRRTDIERKKDGSIKGAPTKVWYYLLNSPDDELNDENCINTLTEDNKNKTQKRIREIIGSFDNFIRIVLTTSDTLNRILSNDMATFIDSILYDSGLDIFDKKLNACKNYEKEKNKKSRINCNIEATTNENKRLKEEINVLESEIKDIKQTQIPNIENRIEKGNKYLESLTKKLYKIDPEIVNLNVQNTKDNIEIHTNNIHDLEKRKQNINNSINDLIETYDEERLNELIEKRDAHKENEYNFNLQIKELQQEIDKENHNIEIINGKIHIAKQEGQKLKNEIIELKESKICPTCGQPLTEEHQHHINEKIKNKENEMYKIADEIKNHQKTINEVHKPKIDDFNAKIESINNEISNKSLQMENILNEIGKLTNEKNDVEKRKKLMSELDQIPTKIENEELKKSALDNKLKKYNDSLTQIKENEKIENGINATKKRIDELREEKDDYNETVVVKNNEIAIKTQKIDDNKKLMNDFKEQEYQDKIIDLYKKCVHRDGIPRQLLINQIIPKINMQLENVLSIAPFKVWLDSDDLRPKLMYYNTPDSVIDAISSSGKERTFSSIVLKLALNEMNVKSKPTIFLLDEIMGKLDNEGSVEEFIQILQIIKEKCKKFLIIEHTHEVNPDYIISVERDENGISSAITE